MGRVTIIAEAGVNHNGNIDTAKKMVEQAAKTGADIVKFQTFCPERLATQSTPMANYQTKNIGKAESQLEMLRGLCISEKDHQILADHCRNSGILFLSSPFDIESIDLLMDYSMPFWKIPSGELTNFPYLKRIAETNRPAVLSTGMSTMAEIRWAVNVLQQNGAQELTLLHCNTEYPTPYEDVNLQAMKTMKSEFSLPIGYSDHTEGWETAIAAAALGACIIEKHFTLDRSMKGPDHKASLEPCELRQMVAAIRHVEAALGDGAKEVSRSERCNLAAARKSITAKRKIARGELFTEQNLTTKRPGTGISPMLWLEVLGKRAKRNFDADEQIEL